MKNILLRAIIIAVTLLLVSFVLWTLFGSNTVFAIQEVPEGNVFTDMAQVLGRTFEAHGLEVTFECSIDGVHFYSQKACENAGWPSQ